MTPHRSKPLLTKWSSAVETCNQDFCPRAREGCPFTNPHILIFDEATSALDYESEAIIQRNMQTICKGRTVIIIAYRLSAVRHAHRIAVMERGGIVELGTHEALLQQGGAYAKLWAMQSGAGPSSGGAH